MGRLESDTPGLPPPIQVQCIVYKTCQNKPIAQFPMPQPPSAFPILLQPRWLAGGCPSCLIPPATLLLPLVPLPPGPALLIRRPSSKVLQGHACPTLCFSWHGTRPHNHIEWNDWFTSCTLAGRRDRLPDLMPSHGPCQEGVRTALWTEVFLAPALLSVDPDSR